MNWFVNFRAQFVVLFISVLVFSPLVYASSCTTIFNVDARLTLANPTFIEEYFNIVEGFVSRLQTINVEVITVATYRSPTSSALDDARIEHLVAIKQHFVSLGFSQDLIFVSVENINSNHLLNEGVIYIEALGLNRKCMENQRPHP